MTVLQGYVVLKSDNNHKYLALIHQNTQVHGMLKFSGNDALSPASRLEVENAGIGNGMVNIRSCYNKYFQRRSAHESWIVATAEKSDENRSSPGCTLFRPESVAGEAQKVRLVHVQLGHYAIVWKTEATHDFNLRVCLQPRVQIPTAHDGNPHTDVFTVINCESLLAMPKHVTFKADNGLYLSARRVEGYPYLQFAADNVGDPTVGHEVFNNGDGSIRIRSDYFGKFWRRSPNWIWADSNDASGRNPDTVFWPIKVDDKTVALRNAGNNQFCKRLTTEGKRSCLNAGVRTIDLTSRLEVAELVLSRSITRVAYRKNDARIYNQKADTVQVLTATNRKKKEDTVQLKFSFTEKHSRTWKASGSLKWGVKSTISAQVPLIVEGKIDLSAEVTTGFEWSDTKEESVTRKYTYTVTVPSMTEVEVHMIATNGSCDVPFNYLQSDTLVNGERVTYPKDDGVFTGVNSYNIRYDTKERPISKS